MFRWLVGRYYARLRRLDIEVLWPTMCERAMSLGEAQMAMVVHASRDPALLYLGED